MASLRSCSILEPHRSWWGYLWESMHPCFWMIALIFVPSLSWIENAENNCWHSADEKGDWSVSLERQWLHFLSKKVRRSCSWVLRAFHFSLVQPTVHFRARQKRIQMICRRKRRLLMLRGYMQSPEELVSIQQVGDLRKHVIKSDMNTLPNYLSYTTFNGRKGGPV
jgi:hypothetical protein